MGCDVREVNKNFSIFCRAVRATGLGKKHSSTVHCTEKLFPTQWQERWRRQSFYSEWGANGADMDTPLTVKHAPTHTILRVREALNKDTGGHLKQVECVLVYESLYGLKASNIKHEWVCISVIALTSISVIIGVNKLKSLCWPTRIKELCIDGCVCGWCAGRLRSVFVLSWHRWKTDNQRGLISCSLCVNACMNVRDECGRVCDRACSGVLLKRPTRC